MDLKNPQILNHIFNADWYLNYYPDVRLLGMDPWDHYLKIGASLDRYLCQDIRGSDAIEILKLITKSDHLDERLLACHANEIRSWCHSSAEQPEFLHARMESMEPLKKDIRAIALYLPQFHAIPENDEWWGKGFTEWTNVKRAKPLYHGHYQPHVPHHDIGYYDLNDETVLEKQAAMARAAGIEGFCFYYYWFNGRRILNMPTDRLLSSGKPDFPFCFCWANENWTRTWDGGDKEILMAQEHSQESDERFIYDLLPAFRDSRYIRVDGKPLLIVYRPGLLPDPKGTAEHWRYVCRREGIGEIFLARMQMFEWEMSNRDIGYDAVIQFPPVASSYSGDVKEKVKLANPDLFKGSVHDYRFTAAGYAHDDISETVWPAVSPSWDNTARRLERGTSWINSSPYSYYKWLKYIVSESRKKIRKTHRFLFINAWNEWAEGCHLEPDEKYGYQWLNATHLALMGGMDLKITHHSQRPRVLVVGHDAARAGAQIVLLTMLQEWRAHGLCDFQLVLLGDGVLRKEFEAVCATLVLSDYATEALQKQALLQFCDPSPDVILANTVVAGPFLPAIKHFGVPIVSYVHELQKSIERWAPGTIMRATVENSDHFIAVSAPVADNLHRTHSIPVDKTSTLNPYIKTSHSVPTARLQALRAELGIQPNEKIIFGCGTIDWRKGPDLFVQAALEVLKKVPEARFFWVGGDLGDEASARARVLAADSRIRFIGERENPRDYLALGHVFFLSSREDPFPLVALEAADAGLPIVCFAEAGGMPEFVGNTCGRTVPFENTQVAASALVGFLTKESLRQNTGLMAQAAVRAKHDAVSGSAAVLSILQGLLTTPKKNAAADASAPLAPKGPLVSVIVPNYNHAQFLPKRLESIASQTLSDFEIILMDDFSTDESLEVLRAFAAREPRARLVLNSENSGSTFKQWRKGFAEAKGKYIWIAESDDFAEPSLLETLVGRLESNPAAILAACCPCSVEDEIEHGPPRQWYNELLGSKWESDYTANGLQEIREVLSQRNSILNASGVVFRNLPDLPSLVEQDMRLCADWLFWVRLLRNGDFEYSHRMLNKWRINSSNARTRPPGELEWREGRHVLSEIAEILSLDPVGRANLLHAFSRECQSWLADHLHRAKPPVSASDRGPKVTAIVPNFNYATYLPERLDSILGQTYRNFEILILDDASTDSSLEIIESYRRRFPNLIRVLPNSINSGSPYPQWLRGIREARSELVWIAEADDSCEPDFLETLVPSFENPSVGITYCQSLGLDGEGRVTRTEFLEHTEGLHPDRWKADYTEIGVREAIDWMACRNTIPNASAALMRREALLDVGDELLAYRSCGDWFLYLQILRKADVTYCARSLNKFRRHERAVTRSTNQSEAYLAELASIRRFVAQAFPLHHSQLQRLDHFLDHDYVFEGISRPSQHPATRPLLEEAGQQTAGRLRLAFISTNISAHSGGSEILWQKAALEARRRGHDVIAVTKAWRPLPPFSAEFAKAGIKHLETEHGGHEAVISFHPDLAIISTSNENEGWLEFQKFPPAGIPYVVVNQLTKEESLSPIPDYNQLLREGIAQAKRMFFVSRNNHRIMERRLGTPIPHAEIVFNPLDIPSREPIPMPDFSEGIHIAFPANILFIHKGHDLLLEVMAMEKWRQRSVTINVYGQGEDEDKVRHILAELRIRNVHLQGFIAPGEIWRHNHAILLASRMEGQSMAMIGAMMAGRVPIVTAVGGSAEVIQDNETGFLAATPSVTDLDNAMERAYQRRADWPQIGRIARESALKLVPQDPVGDFISNLEQVCSRSVKMLKPNPNPYKEEPSVIKYQHGFCPICDDDAIFTAKNSWLRDHYLCSGCGSIPRERAIMHVIQTRYPNWRELRIHENSPGSRGTSVKLAKECKNYTYTQYDPDLGFGNTHCSRGYRSENLEQQTFPDESFDIVVSQDMMEHIFDAEAAFKDIHRTLKPGGAHIFTTPLVNKEKPTQRRAELRHDGTVHHLIHPEYHENPMSSEGSLVTFHWGYDIVDLIKKYVSDNAEIIHQSDPHMGIEAEYIEVLVQCKNI
jgi:glycosyltransferase involved in cell wall biosynthesis/glycogen synthase/SAM-dependent methyltransferase